MRPRVVDSVLSEDARRRVHDFLLEPGWKWGWKSNPKKKSSHSFWHKHFAGWRKSEDEPHPPPDVSGELDGLMLSFWRLLNSKLLPDYVLSRCYANAMPYGTDGAVHVDSLQPGNVTAIYYPHGDWDPDWGGETVFFNEDKTDVIYVCYPRPNRIVIFDGRIPHVARGVARTCPQLRITLMFKAWKNTSDS